MKNNNVVSLKIRGSRNEASGTGVVPDYLALARGPCNASIETIALVVGSKAALPVAAPVAVAVGCSIAPGLVVSGWHGYTTCCARCLM